MVILSVSLLLPPGSGIVAKPPDAASSEAPDDADWLPTGGGTTRVAPPAHPASSATKPITASLLSPCISSALIVATSSACATRSFHPALRLAAEKSPARLRSYDIPEVEYWA